MKVSDLTEAECNVWQAAATGALLDLRIGDPKIDSPEKWTDWGPERTVRAEVIAALLLGDSDAATTAVRGVRVRGARIVGDLDLKATTLRCPLALLNCSFTSALNLEEAMAVSVCLSGSHVPLIRARQLQTRGDLRLDKGFNVSLGVELVGAHIGGDLDCTGAQFSNPAGLALNADWLTVDGSLFCRQGFSATGEVRLRGARIGGVLDCTGGQFSNPTGLALNAYGLTIGLDIICRQGFSATGEVRLQIARIGGNLDCGGGQFSNPNGPALNAYGLTIDGDMLCRTGFSASGEVNLVGAHIGIAFDCGGGQFSNPNGPALNAERLIVDGGMFCRQGFSATGEVRLQAARIGIVLDCEGGQFSNPNGPSLTASGLTVDGDMLCRTGFSASGEVNLLGAHIGGNLDCGGGQFSNPNGPALVADRLAVDGNMFCRQRFSQRFSANGEVILLGAHIGGNLDCGGGQFSNPNGPALVADRLTVDGGMFCRQRFSQRFSANGEVILLGAHIGIVFDCTGGHFSNAGGSALNLEGASVSGPLLMKSAMLEGILDLTAAKTSSYHDDPASWPETLRLDGFVYDTIDGASAKERREKSGWLRRNETVYSPQIYNQLTAVYRSAGQEDDARLVLIAKQRRRFAQRNLLWKLGGYVLDGLVGYGYRTWLAFVWVSGLLVLGTILFNYLYSAGDLTAASKTTPPPPFQPFLYTLDLLLPVASLHQRDGWVTLGVAQWCSVIFIIMGWVLATAVVLSLTGLLKRD